MLIFAVPAAPHPIPVGIVANIGGWVGTGQEERDFEARRRSCTRSARRGPLLRVAALLVSISRNNGYEGRDPDAIPECLTSGFVAELLGLSITAVADVLVELTQRSLVASTPSSGLRLTDVAGLERLAGAA